ncbi:MAG: vitamin K epoxide reductase family protein [Candidatus Saccharibacteria bacterium]|nr:vitamin K epoxide reductase family protein [Candidatus Saccharibacteria bacterium]
MVNIFRKYFALLPVLYLFVAIFLARSKVQYVYLAAAILVALTFAINYKRKLKPEIFLAYWMAVLAVLGLSAAVILSIEKVELLANPNRIASCSLSPIVACSPVIASPQSSAFGFPNSFIGIFGFTAIFVAAMTILAGATKLSKVWWRTLLGGIIFGAGFCTWLFHEGVYEIGKLCLYCMLVWLVTFALLWLVTAHSIENKYINLGAKLNKLLSYKYELIATTYLVIFILLFFRWSDYWTSLL